MKLPLLILLLSSVLTCLGQNKAARELELFLSKKKINSFITLTTGCTSCKLSYDDTTRPESIETIKLIYKDNSKNYFVCFSDTARPYSKIVNITSIFDFATNSAVILKNKKR